MLNSRAQPSNNNHHLIPHWDVTTMTNLFRSWVIFVLSTMPQFTQLYKCVPSYKQRWKLSEYTSRSNYSMAEFFPEKFSWCRDENSDRGWRIKCFVRFNGIDTLPYKNIPCCTEFCPKIRLPVWNLLCCVSGWVARVERGTVFREGWWHEGASWESEECPGRKEERGGPS